VGASPIIRRLGGAQEIPRPTVFRVCPDDPWCRNDVSALALLQQVTDNVVRFSELVVHPPPPDGLSLSAVLVALFEGANGTEVVLTRRSMQLTNHKGQISFPGGRVDANEDVVGAALREAYEEIALHPNDVEVIGQLDAFSTYVSDSYIIPVVARLKSPPSLAVQNGEVDRVFSVPLVDLVRRDTYSEEFWGTVGNERRLHFFYLDDETVWGVTGHMLYQLLSVALGR